MRLMAIAAGMLLLASNAIACSPAPGQSSVPSPQYPGLDKFASPQVHAISVKASSAEKLSPKEAKINQDFLADVGRYEEIQKNMEFFCIDGMGNTCSTGCDAIKQLIANGAPSPDLAAKYKTMSADLEKATYVVGEKHFILRRPELAQEKDRLEKKWSAMQ